MDLTMKMYWRCLFVITMIASTTPVFARGGLGTFVGELIGGYIGKSLGKSAVADSMSAEQTSSEKSTPVGMSNEQLIVKVCDQINQQLPMLMDKETRLDIMTPGPGLRITYNLTLVYIGFHDVDLNYFIQNQTQRLRRYVCSNLDMKVFMKNAITVSYSYRANDGIRIGKIDVVPSDCLIYEKSGEASELASPNQHQPEMEKSYIQKREFESQQARQQQHVRQKIYQEWQQLTPEQQQLTPEQRQELQVKEHLRKEAVAKEVAEITERQAKEKQQMQQLSKAQRQELDSKAQQEYEDFREQGREEFRAFQKKKKQAKQKRQLNDAEEKVSQDE